MEFIKLKGVQAQRFRKNGSREITPLFVTKSLLKLHEHALDI